MLKYMEVEFTAQAQRFVRSAVFSAVPLGLAFRVFWSVGCGRAIRICGAVQVLLKLT